ncbi:MAG: hypothetical protein KBF35_03170 [Saprospiraceae bacterium]|nr:hypothetical protein [Saprospiraceae bacterium]
MLLQLQNSEADAIKKNCLILFWSFSAPILFLESAKLFHIPILIKIAIAVFYILMFLGATIYLYRLFDPADKGRILHPELINFEPAKRKDLFTTYLFMILAGTFPINFIGIFDFPFFYHILAIFGLLMMLSMLIYFGKFEKVNQNYNYKAASLPDKDIMTGFIFFFLLIMGIISILLSKNASL